MFDLMQTVDKPLTDVDICWIGFSKDAMTTFSKLHTFLINLHQTTSLSSATWIFCTKPTINLHLQKKTNFIDNCMLMQDIKQCLDSTVMFTAAQLDSVLRSLLDKHAPMNNCKVSHKEYAPWYDNISNTLPAAKMSHRKAERFWH